MATSGTPIEMRAQGRGPAVRDRAKHTQVLRGEPGTMGLDEACPVLANDAATSKGGRVTASGVDASAAPCPEPRPTSCPAGW